MRRLNVRLGNLLKRALAPAALCMLAVTGCGSQQKPPAATTQTTTTPAANTHSVWIYSSAPSWGPDRAATLQIREGIRLALGPLPKRYHGFQIHYAALNDSFARRVSRHGGGASPSTIDKSRGGTVVSRSGNTNGWNPTATIGNAERAARNPQTIAYLGDLNSGATEVSLPILNQAGIAQIAPGSGYPGLTDSYSSSKGIVITQPGEPAKYYPQSPRSLLRMIPSDIVQASAALSVLRKGGCQTVAAWQFGGESEISGANETATLLGAVIRTAPLYGMKYVAPPKLPSTTKQYVTYVAGTLKPLNLRCAVLVGRPTPAAEMLTTELREQLGPLPIIGTNGFCNSAWARGIPKPYAKAVIPDLYCTTPALPIADYPQSGGFVARFVSAYHRRPTAYAYYGYEAAEMVMRALQDVASADDPRQRVLFGLVQEFIPDELGPSFTFSNGSVESTRYGIDHFSATGLPVHHETVAPGVTHLLPSAG